MATRQQLEAQLVAAHRSGNVAAAQQAAYAIRAFDQNSLMAQVPTVNAPAVNRPVQPRWDDMLTQFSQGLGSGIKSQLQGVEQIVTQPVESAKALYQAGVEAFRDPAKALGEAWSGIRSTAERATSSPMGFGQVLGENVNIVRVPGGRRQPTQAELDVYHGTPHTFEPEEGAPLGRFRSKAIGTGEGAQAYGHGLYLAENEKIGRHYKEVLSKRKQPLNYTYNGVESKNLPFPARSPQRIYAEQYIAEVNKGAEPEKIIEKMKNDARNWLSRELKILKRYEKDLGKTIDIHNGKNDFPEYYTYDEGDIDLQKEAVEVAKSYVDVIENFTPDTVKFTKQGEGSLYKVDLPDAKIEQMLDWDKPFSQQSDHVKQILKDSGIYQEYRANLSDFSSPMATRNRSMRGENFLAFVENKFQSEARDKVRNGELIADTSEYGARKAAEYLQSLGIPGIKYLDASSRSGKRATRNFVVFPGEEQNLTILSRD